MTAQKRKAELDSGLCSSGEETGVIAEWWKQDSEDLLIPTNMSSIEEAEIENFGEGLSITLAPVTGVVKKLLSGKSPVVDEIHAEMLKALDTVGLSWLTRLLSVM